MFYSRCGQFNKFPRVHEAKLRPKDLKNWKEQHSRGKSIYMWRLGAGWEFSMFGEEVFCLFTSLFFLKQMECSHPTRVLEITLSRANSNCYSRIRFQRISAWFIWAFGHRKEKLRTKLLWTNIMVKVKLLSHVRLCDPMDCSIPASSLRDFPGKSSTVGCHLLLQGIFPTWGSKPSLPHCRQTLYRLSHQGSPSIMVAAAAKLLQSCLTLSDPMDCSLPGSSIHGIFQARTLEWVAISFSNAWKWKVKSESEVAPILSNPMDCSLPGSSVHGIFQARVLEWGAIAFFKHNGTCP